jgi:hypothetical protein
MMNDVSCQIGIPFFLFCSVLFHAGAAAPSCHLTICQVLFEGVLRGWGCCCSNPIFVSPFHEDRVVNDAS